MNKKLRRALVGALFFITASGAVSAQGKEAVGAQVGLEKLSHLQSLLEYYFLETGLYPASLDGLNAAYNSKLSRGAKPVPIPVDPATGKSFVYEITEGRKSYAISFPDAAKYGLPAGFKFKSVSWGWLALRAEQKIFQELVTRSSQDMNTLATHIEMYAKDNGGSFPQTLDQLFPKYIKRHPQDPVSGKNYLYTVTSDGYRVSSPNPKQYGLKVFQYSSSEGIQVEVLPDSE